ncbi:MAG TPA: hypothetical protein VJH20_00580 [Candidatus Nanoarchaeia archaeon]|nr:hypothetical protein [Candidatus Nanoarchaeia archaeon]
MRKAQVSIFIILGIVIMLLIVILVYFRTSLFKSDFEVNAAKSVNVPEQVKPVKQFIDSCILVTAQTGINTLGWQGGFISIPIDNVPRGYFNKFSNSLELMPSNIVPYWFYETSNGIQKTQVPSKETMENELSLFIDANLQECLKELFLTEDYSKYNIEFKDAPKTTTKIESNFIEVKVNYPVNIYLNEIGKLIDTHYVKVDAPLGELYQISKEILEKNNNDNFFEKKTIDILALYKEIPYSGITLDCNSPTWTKTEVTNNLKNLLSFNIAAVKLKGSNYVLLDESHKYFELETPSKDNEIVANFLFAQSWPLEIEIYPSENEILSSDQITKSAGNQATELLSKIFCLNSYNFVYDIKYPVLVTLEKNGYTFQYTIQVIIDNNQPKVNKYGTLDLPETSFDICSRKVTPVTVFALEEKNNKFTPIEADISYQCFATTCYIGKTIRDEYNEYSLTALFPQCINGQVIATNDNYLTSKTFIDTNEEITTSVILKPYYNFNYDIKIIEKSSGYIREIQEDEKVLFQFEKDDNEYSTFITNEEASMKLILGNYKVKSYLSKTSDSKFNIQPQEISKCIKIPRSGILGLFLSKEKCATTKVEGTELEEVITGGAEFEVKIDDLNKDSQKIIIYTIFDKIPNSFEDLTNIEKDIAENSKLPSFKLPEFKNE